jgi:hypothetical protein
MTQTVAVDFDGVIHLYTRGWFDGTIYDPPVPGALDALAALQADYAVFVHTTRQPVAVAEWLVRQGEGRIECVTEHPGEELLWKLTQFPPEGRHWHVVGDSTKVTDQRTFWDDKTRIFVTNRKLPAVAYIDDRGIRFTDWNQALADLAAQQSAPPTRR